MAVGRGYHSTVSGRSQARYPRGNGAFGASPGARTNRTSPSISRATACATPRYRNWPPHGTRDLVESLSRTAELLGADEEALTHAGRHALSESTLLCGRNRVLLDRRVVQSYSLGIRRRLLRLAAGGLCTVVEALSFSETERLIRLTGGDGHVVLRGKLSAWSSRGVLGIESADLWTGPMQVHPGGAAKVPGWGTLVVESMCPDSAADREIELQEGPFTLRRWRPGDAIDQGAGQAPGEDRRPREADDPSGGDEGGSCSQRRTRPRLRGGARRTGYQNYRKKTGNDAGNDKVQPEVGGS